jgi:SagB-type dehydrogenase family enzyme
MRNREIDATAHFHNGTKHPGGFLLDPNHRYNPAENPILFKHYPDLEPILLPIEPGADDVPALRAIGGDVLDDGSLDLGTLDLSAVARILHFSAGITKHIKYPPPWGEIPFRAAACTGALYHIELYLLCSDLPRLEAGVYHYDPRASALRQLRLGDYRTTLLGATDSEPTIADAPATIAFTQVPFRNAVKYQARAYRHAFWDCGTILSNALALASAGKLSSKVVLGFVDSKLGRLLGLKPGEEHALALLPLGRGHALTGSGLRDVERIEHRVAPIADRQIDFPAIGEMHQASSLMDREEVGVWRTGKLSAERTPPKGEMVGLTPFSPEDFPAVGLDAVIQKRGSSRKFELAPITLPQLSTILASSVRPIDFDLLDHQVLNQAYLIVSSVEGLDSGTYVYHDEAQNLEVLERGAFRNDAGTLALNQALGADASVCVYFLVPLDPILKVFGNRGYRLAQLEASVFAGRMYLAAYALGLGATGLTFYDDLVTEFFSPHALGKSVMFLIALGIPA